MPDPITRLNAALEGRYSIERELGEGRTGTMLGHPRECSTMLTYEGGKERYWQGFHTLRHLLEGKPELRRHQLLTSIDPERYENLKPLMEIAEMVAHFSDDMIKSLLDEDEQRALCEELSRLSDYLRGMGRGVEADCGRASGGVQEVLHKASEMRFDCVGIVRREGRPDERCLELAARTIAHDVDQLLAGWAGRRLSLTGTLWFIAARALSDFFFTYERGKSRDGDFTDEILAADFLDSGEWRPIAEGMTRPASFDDVREAATGLSATIRYSNRTYARAISSEEASLLPSAEVHDFLISTAAEWGQRLKPDRRAWFDTDWPTGLTS